MQVFSINQLEIKEGAWFVQMNKPREKHFFDVEQNIVKLCAKGFSVVQTLQFSEGDGGTYLGFLNIVLLHFIGVFVQMSIFVVRYLG